MMPFHITPTLRLIAASLMLAGLGAAAHAQGLEPDWRVRSSLTPAPVPFYDGQPSPFPIIEPPQVEILAPPSIEIDPEEEARNQRKLVIERELTRLIDRNQAFEPNTSALELKGTLKNATGALALIGKQWHRAGDQVSLTLQRTDRVRQLMEELALLDNRLHSQIEQRLQAHPGQSSHSMTLKDVTETTAILESALGRFELDMPKSSGF